MTSLPRREFLLRALAACATAGLGPSRLASAAQSNEPGRVPSTSAAYFGDQGAIVRAFGEAYLRLLGRDQGEESVRAASRGTLALIDKSHDPPGAIHALVRAVQRDFEQGRVVQLEGWVVSRTEAELCAITLMAESIGDHHSPMDAAAGLTAVRRGGRFTNGGGSPPHLDTASPREADHRGKGDPHPRAVNVVLRWSRGQQAGAGVVWPVKDPS